MLDDYHAIESAEVHEAVTVSARSPSEHVHLVMATRSDPPFPLARMRSRGQLSELRVADLRFTPSEAREFLNGRWGSSWQTVTWTRWKTGRRAGSLACSWPHFPCAASRIATRSPTSSRPSPGATASSSTTWPTRCWPGKTQPVRDFLLRTAVLDRLNGPLCDAVTGGTDGSRMLENLERENLFVVPLDTERLWYRYHHLFADVLQRTSAGRAPRSGAGAAWAGQCLVRRSRHGRGCGPARARRRRSRAGGIPDGGGAGGCAPRPAATACS